MTTTKVPQKNYLTTEHRYLTALSQIQAKGVLVFDNYPTCCGSCASYEIEQHDPGTDNIFFPNSQGRALKFIGGVPYNYETYEGDSDDDDTYATDQDERRATQLYWSHSTLKAAQAVHKAFVDNGFTVEWDGTVNKCVVVQF